LAATLNEFQERIEDYMELRENLADEVGGAEITRDPRDILNRKTTCQLQSARTV
jgi:hypothetical protein